MIYKLKRVCSTFVQLVAFIALGTFSIAVHAVQGVVEITDDENFGSFSGFFMKDDKNKIYLVTATHAVNWKKTKSYTVIIGRGQMLPRNAFIYSLTRKDVVVSVPTEAGDITVFDVNRFNFAPLKVYASETSQASRNARYVNTGIIGSVTDSKLWERSCNYLRQANTYSNGIELHELSCHIPAGMTHGHGTSGNPVEDLQTGSLIGMVSGSFSDTNLSSVGIHTVNLNQLLRSRYRR